MCMYICMYMYALGSAIGLHVHIFEVMYECMSYHLTCTHHISILHTHVNVCILPDQAEVVKKGFQMKVRQSSGAGKIVFRAVKNFNNIPHILEIRVFSFTRFLKFQFIVFGGCSSLRFFFALLWTQGAASVCVWASDSEFPVGQVDLLRAEAVATDW